VALTGKLRARRPYANILRMKGLLRRRELEQLEEANERAEKAHKKLTEIKVRLYEIYRSLNTGKVAAWQNAQIEDEKLTLERDAKIAEQTYRYWVQWPVTTEAKRLGIDIPEKMYDTDLKYTPGRVLLDDNLNWVVRQIRDYRLSRCKDISAIITPILSLVVAILSLIFVLTKRDAPNTSQSAPYQQHATGAP